MEIPRFASAGSENDEFIAAEASTRDYQQLAAPSPPAGEFGEHEVAARYELLPHGEFISSAQVLGQLTLGMSRIAAITHMAERGSLLAQHVPNPTAPDDEPHFYHSRRYLAALESRMDDALFDSPEHMLRTTAVRDWARSLAWGIRAEHLDTLRALAPQLTIAEAMALTGLSQDSLLRRGFVEETRVTTRHIQRTVPTADLMRLQRWHHLAFEPSQDSPKNVRFCDYGRAAKILGPQAGWIVRHDLLPGWHVPVTGRRGTIHFAERDLLALRAFRDRFPEMSLTWAAMHFIDEQRHLYTETRGEFERYFAHLLRTHPNISHEALEAELGVSEEFFRDNSTIQTKGQSAATLFQRIRWIPLKLHPEWESTFHRKPNEVKRAAILLYRSGMSQPETADTIGVPLNRVRVWLRMAAAGERFESPPHKARRTSRDYPTYT